MNLFLRMKHWQLFIIMFALPVVLSLIGYGPIYSSLLFVISYTLWLLVLGFSLFNKTESNPVIKKTILCVQFVVNLSNICLNYLFVDCISELHNNFNGLFDLYNVFSIAMNIVVIIIIAKALVKIELKRNVTFEDYKYEVLFIWLSVIGVWIIQPRINSIFKKL